MEDIINVTVYETPYGVAGPQGPQGITGATGPQGPAGPTGAQGDPGDVGPPGPPGDIGPQGPQGPQGIQGDPGNTGPQGEVGPTGPQGNTGSSGDIYRSTSTTTVDLSGITFGDIVELNVGENYSYSKVQTILVANDTSNYFTGLVSSYSGETLSVEVNGLTGSGSFSSWDVNLAGAVGQAGPQGAQGNTGATGAQGNTGNTPTDYVASFNGLTGDVFGVPSINGSTAAAEVVSTLNGMTGTITNVAFRNIGNTFSVAQKIDYSSKSTTILNNSIVFNNPLTGITRTINYSALGFTNTQLIIPGESGTIALTSGVISSFNGKTGDIQGLELVTAGAGMSLSGQTGSVIFQNTGVLLFNGLSGGITLAAGSNIGLTTDGNVITISSTGSSGATSGVESFNGFTGAVTGVSSLVASTGIFVSGATGNITVSNTGVRTLTGNASQITVAGSTGDVVISLPKTISSVNSISAEEDTNLVLNSTSSDTPSENTTLTLGAGGVTSSRSVSIVGSLKVSGSYEGTVVRSFNGVTGAVQGVQTFNGRTGAVQGVSAAFAGTGIGLSGTTGNITISNIGVLSMTLGIGRNVTGGPGANAGLNISGTTGNITLEYYGTRRILAGQGITLNPAGGTGLVVITNAGLWSLNGLSFTDANIIGSTGISVTVPSSTQISIENSGVLSVNGQTGDVTVSGTASGVTDGSAIIWNLQPLGNTTGDLIAYSGNSWAVTPRDYVTTPSIWQTVPDAVNLYPSSKFATSGDSVNVNGTTGDGFVLGELVQISLWAADPNSGITLNSGTWWLNYTVYTDASLSGPGILLGAFSGLTLVSAPRHFQPQVNHSGDAMGFALKIRGSTYNAFDGRGGPYGDTGCTLDPNQKPLNPSDPCAASGIVDWTVCTQPVRGFTYNGCYYPDGCGNVICP